MDTKDLPTWDLLMKKIVWQQIGPLHGKKILDFGSGLGVTANYFANENEVVAIEPCGESIENRWRDNEYKQLQGSTEVLRQLPTESFDVIICHNVLEYAGGREQIIKEFSRVLKKDGFLSLVKHNRAGRVMQMVVLLNDFAEAGRLLDGNDGRANKFGPIHYYEDADVCKWSDSFMIEKTMGMRSFWDLQQNQEIQKNPEWQQKMMEIDMRVSEIKEYQDIAFFHHLIIRKK
jgi:SAM-dependent methyltransferase